MPVIARSEKRRAEATIEDGIRAALAKMPDVMLFRNNVGSMKSERGQWFSFGLGPETSDLVGMLRVTTAHHPLARFLAFEVKDPHRKRSHDDREAAQLAWLARVRLMGGIAAMVESVAEVVALLEEARAWRI